MLGSGSERVWGFLGWVFRLGVQSLKVWRFGVWGSKTSGIVVSGLGLFFSKFSGFRIHTRNPNPQTLRVCPDSGFAA